MKRDIMLNKHLQEIYVSEDINKALLNIKSKRKSIEDALKDGNVLKLNKIFETIPNISPKEAKTFSMKKMSKEYKESEKIVNSRMKKAPEDVKTAIIVMRASLSKIQEENEDPDIRFRVKKKLESLDATLSKAGSMIVNKGITVMFIAAIIRIFMSSIFVSLSMVAGVYVVLFGLIIHMLAFLVKVFVESKKAGERVIS